VSRLASLAANRGSTAITNFGYTYDDAGNRMHKSAPGSAEDYSYDPLYRLTQVVRNSSTAESYTYDPVGNRLSSLSAPLWTYNAQNQLVSQNGAIYTYDANGNLAQRVDASGTWSYTWNAANQLTAVSRNGTLSASFLYDPLGRRVNKGGTTYPIQYTYDGEDILIEWRSSTDILMWIHGPGIDEPLASQNQAPGFTANWKYRHLDGLGSLVKTVNASGVIISSVDYDAFGNGGTVTGYGFTGREFDPETGLLYYRARYYDPKIGRFLSEDPIGFSGGINLYTYVYNNPANLIDPYGLQGAGYGYNFTSYMDGALYRGEPCPKDCTLQVLCGVTQNTQGWLHCTVTVCKGTKCTAYDGEPEGGIFAGQLKIRKAPAPPPGGSQTFQVPCDCAGQVAQRVNNGHFLYSFPLQNSNSAASWMTANCGVTYHYPFRAWGGDSEQACVVGCGRDHAFERPCAAPERIERTSRARCPNAPDARFSDSRAGHETGSIGTSSCCARSEHRRLWTRDLRTCVARCPQAKPTCRPVPDYNRFRNSSARSWSGAYPTTESPVATRFGGAGPARVRAAEGVTHRDIKNGCAQGSNCEKDRYVGGDVRGEARRPRSRQGGSGSHARRQDSKREASNECSPIPLRVRHGYCSPLRR
jgi:RHS repeat-associated protein